MSIEIERLDDTETESWNTYVSRAEFATPFHEFEALQTLSAHSGTELHPLVGYKGQEPVGLFPVFEKRKGSISAVFSPPPKLKIHYLGPLLLNVQKLKRRKRDRRHRRFVEGCLEWIDDRCNPKYQNFRTDFRYDDTRPFIWNDFDVTPRYTYVVDLSADESDLLASFSSDARSNITSTYDLEYEVAEGDQTDIDRIIDQVHARHAEQDESFPIGASFIRDLSTHLPDGVVRPYVLTVDDQFVGGIIGIETETTMYSWVGGAKTNVELPVNDLIDWEMFCDGKTRGIERYDLGGANNRRLCGYKAKFAPELETYYRIQKGSMGMNTLSKLYRRFG